MERKGAARILDLGGRDWGGVAVCTLSLPPPSPSLPSLTPLPYASLPDTWHLPCSLGFYEKLEKLDRKVGRVFTECPQKIYVCMFHNPIVPGGENLGLPSSRCIQIYSHQRSSWYFSNSSLCPFLFFSLFSLPTTHFGTTLFFYIK